MNQHQAKKTRREMRRYFRSAGLGPDALAAKFRLQVRPCPRWMPLWAWRRLALWTLRPPAARDAMTAKVA